MLKRMFCLEKVKALKDVLVNEKGKLGASPWGFLGLGRVSFGRGAKHMFLCALRRREAFNTSNRKMGEC
jgi:hypothetical protein